MIIFVDSANCRASGNYSFFLSFDARSHFRLYCHGNSLFRDSHVSRSSGTWFSSDALQVPRPVLFDISAVVICHYS